MSYRVVFMGTPQFALPTLQELIDKYSAQGIVGVFTQPERPRGRGRRPQPSPVKVLAQQYGIPVLEPASLRDPETHVELQALRPDVIVVAAFGQILPSTVLKLPPYGCINVHASLLPRWRGAAPVATAILAGDDTTGATVMKMDVGLDTGPILSQRSLAIAPDDTRDSLTTRLAQLGADLLRDTLSDWLAGSMEPQPQDEALATYAHQLKKEQGRINWGEPAEDIARQIRAFNPWPGAFTFWQDKPLRVLRAAPTEIDPPGVGQDAELLPGTVIAGPDGPAMVTGVGILRLYEVQLAGKRPMPADAFARGARDFFGARLA